MKKFLLSLLLITSLITPSVFVSAQELSRDDVVEVAPEFLVALNAMSNALTQIRTIEQQEQMILSHIGAQLPALSAQVAYINSANLTNEDAALETVSNQLANYNREITAIAERRNTREDVLTTMKEILTEISEMIGEVV